MLNIETINQATDTAKTTPRYQRRRSDPATAAQRANDPSVAAFDPLAAARVYARRDRQRMAGDKGIAAASVAPEAIAADAGQPVASNISEIRPNPDLATRNMHASVVEFDDDKSVQRVPFIVTLLAVVGISALIWGGIVALVFAL